MADIVIKTVQFKRGSEANLIAKLKIGELGVPLAGEPIYATDTHILKIGDGVQDYEHLPAITGGTGDINFVIHNPLDDQILYFDSHAGEEGAWVNGSITSLLTGYAAATQGQMLVKDNASGLAWVNPVSTSELNAAVAAALDYRNQAGNYATQAGNKAAEASISATQASQINEATMEFVSNKFWYGSIEEYNDLEEILPGTFYFIRAEE